MLGGLRIIFCVLNTQEFSVRVKNFGDRFRYIPDCDAMLARTLDDLVVYIRQIHHLKNIPSTELDYAPQQIFEKKCPKVSDVRRVVNRRPAGVHANGFSVSGLERIDAACEC